MPLLRPEMASAVTPGRALTSRILHHSRLGFVGYFDVVPDWASVVDGRIVRIEQRYIP